MAQVLWTIVPLTNIIGSKLHGLLDLSQHFKHLPCLPAAQNLCDELRPKTKNTGTCWTGLIYIMPESEGFRTEKIVIIVPLS